MKQSKSGELEQITVAITVTVAITANILCVWNRVRLRLRLDKSGELDVAIHYRSEEGARDGWLPLSRFVIVIILRSYHVFRSILVTIIIFICCLYKEARYNNLPPSLVMKGYRYNTSHQVAFGPSLTNFRKD